MPKPKKQLNPKESGKPAKAKRGRITKWDPSMIQVIENIVFDTGVLDGAQKALGVARSTLYRWIDEKPELSDALARARENHRKLSERAFREETVAAFKGLTKLLTGYDHTIEEESCEEIRNKETGEVLETVKVLKKKRTVHVRPDMRAIEKVLGPNELKHNIYITALEEHVLNHNDDLYRLVFGKLGVGEEANEFKGIFVLHAQLDLLKIRYMEAHVQAEYDRQNISIAQYIDYTNRLRRDYGQIMDRMEVRAQKLLQGASYSEILMSIEEMWKVFIETASEEIGRPVERKGKAVFQVPADVKDTICDRITESIHSRQEERFFAIKQLPRP